MALKALSCKSFCGAGMRPPHDPHRVRILAWAVRGRCFQERFQYPSQWATVGEEVAVIQGVMVASSFRTSNSNINSSYSSRCPTPTHTAHPCTRPWRLARPAKTRRTRWRTWGRRSRASSGTCRRADRGSPSPETGAGVRSPDPLMNVGGTKGNKRKHREKNLVRECDKKQKASKVNMNQRHV